MRKKLLKIFIGVSLFFIVLIGVVILLYSYTPIIDQTLLNIINSFTGRETKISYSKIEGNLIGNVRIFDFKLETNKFKLEAPKISLHYLSKKLLENKFVIDILIIDSPHFILERTDTGNFDESTKTRLDSIPLKIDLTEFPLVNIDEFIINEGTFIYQKNGRQLAKFSRINTTASITLQDEKTEFNLKYIKGFWQEKNINIDQLSFLLVGNKRRLTINQFKFLVDENEIFAHGEIELIPRLNFYFFADTSRIGLPLIRKVYPDFPFKDGFVQFYVEFIGIPSDFSGQIYLASELDSLRFSRISSRYKYLNRSLQLQHLRAETNFGIINGSVQIAPEGRNRILLDFSNINLEKISLTSNFTNLNGIFDLKFNTWNLPTISGNGMANLRNIRYGNVILDTLYLNLTAEKGHWTLNKGSRLVIEKSSQFYVQGELTRQRILNVKLTTENNVLDTLSRRLALDDIGGVGKLSVLLTGPLQNPDISGYVLLDSLIYDSIHSYGVEGNFEVEGISRQRLGFIELDLSSGVVADILITDGQVDIKIDRNKVLLDSIRFYNEDNYVTMAGELLLEENTTRIDIFQFIFRYQDYNIFSSDTLEAFYRNDSLLIENFILHATGEGEIEARGIMDFNGNSGLGVYFKNIQLLPFNQFIHFPYEIKGMMEISSILTGKPDSLIFESDFTVNDLSIAEDSVGDITASINYRESILEVEHFEFIHSTKSNLRLGGTFILPSGNDVSNTNEEQIDLFVDFENLKISDYSVLSQQNFPFDGNFSGKVKINGKPSEIYANYQFIIGNFIYKEYEFPKIELEGLMNPSAILLRDGLVNFKGTDIRINGIKPINWDYNHLNSIFSDKSLILNSTISDDSVKFLEVLTPEVDLLTGDISLNVRIGGQYDDLKIQQGSLDIKNGTLYLSKVENPLQEIEFSSVIENDKLVINKAKAKLIGQIEDESIMSSITDFLLEPFRKLLGSGKPEGALEIKGSIDFSVINKPEYDLRINADQVFANYYLENVKVIFSSSNLSVIGKDTLLITGDISIDEGEVDLNLKESEKNLLLSPSVREEPPFLEYRLGITIPGNFYVRSDALFNSFDMMVSGEVQILQEPRGLLEMYGTLDVPKGSYFQFEEFNIRDGKVEFINPKEVPQLNLLAEKKKYGYIFQLHVEGTLNNPLKEIRIYDLQTREDVTHLYPETKDQIALLLFGMTFSELGGSAGTAALEKGQEVINQAIISRIEQEARRFIGLDEIRVESEEGLIDFTNLRLNQASQRSAISLGKYLMPNLYLEYKTQLGSSGVTGVGEGAAPSLDYESGNQVYLEYRINRNWSVSSFYARQLYDKFKIDVSWRYNF